MIDHLHIKNFLAFPELEVPELKLINLVAGKNNVGKTALLDAIWILTAVHRDRYLKGVAKKRGIQNIDQLELFSLINGSPVALDLSFSINDLVVEIDVLEGKLSFFQQQENGERIAIPATNGDILLQENLWPKYIESRADYKHIAKLWKRTTLTEKEDVVLEILRDALDQRINRISITDNEVKVQLNDRKKPVNSNELGDGFSRILLIALMIVNSENGIVLIDEIETHLHFSTLRTLWRILLKYCLEKNIQVIATTHSLDAIRQFWYETAESEELQQNSQVIRLQMSRDGHHETVRFPFDLLDSAMEMKMEIR